MSNDAPFFLLHLLWAGWAIRGHSAMNGSILGRRHGCTGCLLAAKRKDWDARMPVLTVIGGVGGCGSMMSYGLLVGYCRALILEMRYMDSPCWALWVHFTDSWERNARLGLETTGEKKPDWPALLTQMIAAGLFFWSVLIPSSNGNDTAPV